MADSGSRTIEARITRCDVKRFRLGQALVAPAMLITVLARQTEGRVAILAMAGVLGLTVLAFLSAITRFGWQTVRVERSAVWFGAKGIGVPREGVRDWTWFHGVARLYADETSYTLKSRAGSETALNALLRGLLGPPRMLQRRGTFRARMIALAVAILGLASCIAAFAFDSIPLIVAGVPTLGIGTATFGALSQRAVQD